MNQQERDALRAEHVLDKFGECNKCWLPYPCDTIRVLDAYENGAMGFRDALTWNPLDSGGMGLAELAGFEVCDDTENWRIWEGIATKLGWKSTTMNQQERDKCDHITKIVDTTTVWFGKSVTVQLTYCIKCGEKL